MIPAFRKKHTFIQELHPVASLSLSLSLLAMSLITDNPFCQIAVILATAILAVSASILHEWVSWWKICLVIFLAALVLNPLVSRYGTTIIWRGPTVPVFGNLYFTTEALAYGAGMGLRLSAMILVFALITLTVDPDSVLGILKGRGAKSALVSALTIRMVPTTMGDADDLLDAQRSRGIVLDKGSRWALFKSRLPLVKRIFSTSLDRGINLAEAMESRAYGSGKRTRYLEYGFKSGDIVTVAASTILLGVTIAGVAVGLLSFRYYPTLFMQYRVGTFVVLIAPILFAFAFLFLSRMWTKSNWLRLRI